MRSYIMGYSQEAACELGLDAGSLLIVRWFSDFYASPKSTKIRKGNADYMLITPKKLSDDLPILSVGERAIRRKIEALIEAGVLNRIIEVTVYGSRTYYAPGDAYDKLIGLQHAGEQVDPSRKKQQMSVIRYCQNCMIMLTESHMAEIADFLEEGITEEMQCYAVDLTIENGKKAWNYTRSILARWRDNGVNTVDAARLEQAAFKAKKGAPASQPMYSPMMTRVEELLNDD